MYKFASRTRPEKFFACLDNIISMARHNDYFILASLDIDDPSMNNDEIKKRMEGYSMLDAKWGWSLNKVDAINRDIGKRPDFDILCNHSDDMWFIKEGFDLDILEAFKDWNGIVHFPDQQTGAKLISYAMMHKEYYDIDGHIYNPQFDSVYADNYQKDVAEKRKKYKFVPVRILDHRHHAWGYGPADDLLKKTEDPVVYAKDRETYKRLLKELPA
jgi:hypothetical protein